MSGKLSILENYSDPVPLQAPYTERRKGIDYDEKRKECLAKKSPFVDPEFPPHWRSIKDNILYSDSLTKAGDTLFYDLEWVRPKDIVRKGTKPLFISDGPSRFDTKQGILGDCWFVAFAASLANNEELFNEVVDTTQNFDDDAGIFHFKFWTYGKWVDVVIDDRLPCMVKKNPDHTITFEPLFMNVLDNEFWPALMEKAYAKLYGSYARINGGLSTDAFVDFTGGVGGSISVDGIISIHDEDLKNYLKMVAQKNCFGWASFKYPKQANMALDHSYAIMDYQQVTDNEGRDVALVKLYNPHGINTLEFDGDWSDGSWKWSELKYVDKERLLVDREDGEHWMAFEYLKERHETISVAAHSSEILRKLLNPSEMIEGTLSRKQDNWHFAQAHGKWIKGKEFLKEEAALPCELLFNALHLSYGTVDRQFVLTVSESGDPIPKCSVCGCECNCCKTNSTLNKECTIIMSVMEKYERENKVSSRVRGYFVYKMNEQNEPDGEPMWIEPKLSSSREGTSMFQATPGKYLVVVETGRSVVEELMLNLDSKKYVRGEFLIRARSTGKISISSASV